MKQFLRYVLGSCCLLGVATQAYGAARVFMTLADASPATSVPGTGVNPVNVSPGQLGIEVEAWAELTAPGGRINGCQITVPCDIICSGAGRMSRVIAETIYQDPGEPEFCLNGRYCNGGPNAGLICANAAACAPGGTCPAGQSPLPAANEGMCTDAGIEPPPPAAGNPYYGVAHGTSQPAQFLLGDCSFGKVKYDVSNDARGTCILVVPNEPDSAVRDENNNPVPFSTDGITFVIPEGSCCVGQACTDGVIAQECVGGTFRVGVTCAQQACHCLTNADCNDGNACTNDTCAPAGPGDGCSHSATSVPANSCCDPQAGTQSFDDANDCTVDACSGGGSVGTPTHTAKPNGTACTPTGGADANICTIEQCNGGACAVNDLLGTPCVTDADCAAIGGTTCDANAVNPGFCDCIANPTLTIDCTGGEVPNPECFSEGEKITMQIVLGGGSLVINGGQFRLVYDPSCMDFLSIAPGATCDPGSPYTTEIHEAVNEVSGVVFYAVGIDLIQNGGSNQGGTLACASFAKKGTCTDCQVCFDNLNPQHTYLSGPGGDVVIPDLPGNGCGCHVQTLGVTTVTTPEGGSFNADCDSPTAIVTWAAPSAANNSCEGPLDLTCTCSHTNPLVTNCSNLIAHGGEFPQGTATFECCATDDCGVETCGSWTVFVSDETTMDVVIQLSPTMDDDQFTRCIEFGFYSNCVEAPEIFKEEITFGPPWDFPGHATYDIKVPKGQFACLTARDQAHTLRSTSDIECAANGHLSAEFKGDPFFGGNWLIGGNLDGSHIIDILDFGVLVSKYLKPGDVDNTCDEIKAPGYRDADINADGIVDSLDYGFIQRNFLEDDKDTCCPDEGGTGGNNGPVYTSVTVQQLRAMGLADLVVADLNHDGVLDTADMEAFQAGAVPAPERGNKQSSRR